MTPYFETEQAVLYLGDCRDVLPEISGAHACVTDPPYGLKFMGKSWDHGVPGLEFWAAVMGSCLPGAHLLAFGGTRTVHRLVCAIEDAGWEIRDGIEYLFWVYGSGFPKNLDVSKAIDKAAGVEGDTIGNYGRSFRPHANGGNDGWLRPSHELCGSITAPATEAARQWEGFGTALKPAHEPICLARKPLDGTVAQNVLKHGCGGLNIDGCRVGVENTVRNNNTSLGSSGVGIYGKGGACVAGSVSGRFPANLIHDGSPEVVALFPATGASKANARNNGEFKSVAKGKDMPHVTHGHNDNGGSAARFFYCAKASKADRGEGNNHPTVKPTSLMRYLCRLITPPGGVVLDPFMGSGSTGKAAILEGFRFIGIEKDLHSLEIAKARIMAAIEARAAKSEEEQMRLFA